MIIKIYDYEVSFLDSNIKNIIYKCVNIILI